ncbi:MAG: cytochrome oxidase Cu insertion factor (SCO1/SenC/PrrC family) [Alphaproteobacteria bacterium]|jgi:cytochrome oxidase Cu insertion factor (SCO1/SenC/PrrC family)
MHLNKPFLLVIGALACALLAFALVKGVRLMQGQPTTGQGAIIETAGADIGGPFSLIGAEGKPVSDADFRGRHMLIYFGYSFCPDVCPTELQAMGRALDQLGSKAAQVTPVFVSVDPARDTPAQLEEYVRAFHPRMVGLTGDKSAIDKVVKSYRAYYRIGPPSKPGAMDYLVDHTSFIYLIGPDGKLKALFRGGVGANALAEGLARFLP